MKHGISEAFVGKITNEMAADLQVMNLRVNFSAGSVFFTTFRKGINDDTFQKITDRWAKFLLLPALGLRLTMSQAAGNGLTALSVVLLWEIFLILVAREVPSFFLLESQEHSPHYDGILGTLDMLYTAPWQQRRLPRLKLFIWLFSFPHCFQNVQYNHLFLSQ